MGTNQKLINEENKILKEKLYLIEEEIKKNKNKIENYSQNDINSYRRTDESNYRNIIEKNKKLEHGIENLYFGKLDVVYEGEQEVESVYIGMKSVDVGDDILIHSWAAPIADIYQKYNSGNYDEKIIDSKGKERIIRGNIKEKRRILIEKKEIKDVFSFGKVKEINKIDSFIKDKIENASRENLNVIVETMDEKQNEIIRLPIEKNVVVQGCAGSGKSSVAFHRLAYLVYTYNLTENQAIIISPNKIFQGYTADILMNLGADFNIKQFTFKEFAELTLGRTINRIKDFNNKELSILKTSEKFKLILDRYISHLDKNYIPKEDVYIDGFKLINSEEIEGLWNKDFNNYKINERIEKIKTYLMKFLKIKIENYISIIKDRYINDLKTLEDYNNNPITYNEIQKMIKEEELLRIKRFKKQSTMIINKYINDLKEIMAIESYKNLVISKKLFKELSLDILSEEELELFINSKNKIGIDEVDSIASVYLHYELNENKNKYRHIVIDECQDLSYLEIAILEKLTQSFTLSGDFNQRININKSIATIEDINKLFERYTFFQWYALNKSYRNSKSITNYSNAILEGFFSNKEFIPVAFNRETEKPKVYLNKKDNQIIKDIIRDIGKNKEKEDSIAIITKNIDEAEKYYEKIKNTIKDRSISLINDSYDSYKKGIKILPVELSKGLEFNYVYIVQGEEYRDNEKDRRLLYIATTRALKKLSIYSNEKECFIRNLDKNLWENKEGEERKNHLNDGVKNLIKSYVEEAGGLTEERCEFINNIDSYILLTKLLGKLNELDIEEAFEEIKVEMGKIEREKEKKDFFNEESIKEITFIGEKDSYLQQILNNLKSNKRTLSPKQEIIYNYMINNIEKVSNFNNCKEFADEIDVTSSIINNTFLKLGLGSFTTFSINAKNDLKRADKNSDK